MARAATAGELTNLRSGNQFSRVYAAIHKPAIVFKARVNQTFTTNDKIAQVTYDTVTYGAYTSIVPGMTMYVGSSEGAYDKGMVRVRKAAPTSTVIYIGETSEIDWADDDYLTVVSEFGLWQRHLLIDDDGDVFMDYDVAYSDQHTNFDPVPVMGPPLVLWLATSAVTINLDASNSWCIGSSISSYLWTAVGGNIMSANTATPTLTYNSVGQYLVTCTVTAANGKTATGYRTIYVYSSSSLPPRVRITRQPSGNYETGGWSFGIALDDDADLTDVRERVQVVLFAREWYNGTETSIGPVTNAERVIAWGWIDKESINWNPVAGAVEFEVSGPHAWFDKMTGYPVGLEDTTYADNGGGNPNRWTEMKQLTVNKVVWHFLHWRTTATMVLDIYQNTDTRETARIPAPEASLWRQLTAMLEATILARPEVDRYGRLFCDVDIQLVPVADRTSIPVIMAITGQDWSDEIEIERRIVPEASMVQVTGVYYSSGDYAALAGASPGQVHSHYGQAQQFDGLMLGDQDDTNELAGLIAGKLNNLYPMLPIRLAANNRLMDIAPYQYMTITVSSGDTIRGITLTTVKLIPRSVTFNFDQDTGFFETEIECEAETQALPAATVPLPGSDGGEPLEPPETPPAPPDPPDPTPIEVTGDGKAVVCTSSVVYYTEDFRAVSPTWTDKTGDIAGEKIVDADLRATASGFNMFVITEDSIWFSKTVDQATPTWSKMFDLAASGYVGMRIKFNNTKSGAGALVSKDGTGLDYEIRFLFTQNNGLTWTDNFVKSDTMTGLEYHIEQHDFQIVKESSSLRAGYITVEDRPPASDATYNPWAIAFQHMGTNKYNMLWTVPSDGYGLPAGLDTTYINDLMGGSAEAADKPRWFINQLLSSGERTAVENYLTSVYGTKGTDWYSDTTPPFQNPYDAGATRQGVALSNLAPDTTHDVRVYALWRRYNRDKVTSFDFGAHNGSRVYIGFAESILTSEDAGTNWTTYLATHGAYDLESHAAQPWGNHDITILSEDGDLYRIIDADLGPSFLTETKKMVAQRMASDPENIGWPIMVLAHNGSGTYDLTQVDADGTATVLFMSRTGARSLRYGYGLTRSQRWLYFVDENDIWYSNDGGNNFTSQNGSWTGYANGIVILPVTTWMQQS